jgi:AraC family transcriptional regulator of arabinose operon
MSWTESLNRGPRQVSVGGYNVEVLYWAYSAHIADNVPHRHTYFEVCLVGKYGGGIFTSLHEQHPLKPGDLFIARPGVIHQIQNTQHVEMELTWVSFLIPPASEERGNAVASEDREVLRAFMESSKVVIPPEEHCVTAVWQALQAITAFWEKGGYSSQIEGLMASLLLAIAQAGAGDLAPSGSGFPDSMEKSVAQLALRYVHDNLDRRLPVSEIAAQVHVSTRHLTRLFTEYAGTSPAAYIEHARMDRARALLKDTALPIKAIAAQVGYPDVHHFTRAFCRRHNLAPAAFRKSGNKINSKVEHIGQLV